MVELSGVSVVGAGSFNPAIFHPNWLAESKLLARSDAEHALQEIVVSPKFTAFTAGWLIVQVTLEQVVFSTVEEAREQELRDLAKGVFELLPHTPIDAIGINVDSHFRVPSEDAWHEIGDIFLPKNRWEPLFEGEEWLARGEGKTVGMRSMTVEVWRPNRKDYVRVEVAPSARITPNGVFIGINSHLQLTEGEDRGTGLQAAQMIAERWEDVRGFEQKLQGQILEWAP